MLGRIFDSGFFSLPRLNISRVFWSSVFAAFAGAASGFWAGAFSPRRWRIDLERVALLGGFNLSVSSSIRATLSSTSSGRGLGGGTGACSTMMVDIAAEASTSTVPSAPEHTGATSVSFFPQRGPKKRNRILQVRRACLVVLRRDFC